MQAQSFCLQNNVQASLPVTLEAITSAKEIDNNFQLASAYKTLALNYSRKKFYDSAKLYFTKAIQYRLTTNAYSNIGADYNEFGNFYNKMKDYDNAAKCYALFLEYAQKITDPVDKSIKTAMAFLNTGDIFFKQKQFKKTEASYLKAMNILHFNVSGILQDMPVKSLAMLNSHAELIITLMDNMTELLLQEYKLNHQALYLNACMQTALTTDSIITQIRHEHIAEQTKIYWREKTSRFYANAIEAAYLDKNTNRAFYFLEKSRAVLLGEKLNELNAASFLPATEKKQEEAYQYKIIELEQKLASLDAGSKQFGDTRFQLLNAKDNFENYIKSLEQRYPVYYQNKYADDVPTLQEVQSFLSRTHQSLVHYFFNDTINYALVISPGAVNFTRLYSGRPVQEMLVAFNGLCADKIRQNNNYNEFIQQSNFIYQTVFQPLHIPHGRLIICTDNIVIPFEALCTDKTGRDFLISQYSFDYVYSARFLMQPFKSGSAKGDFIGFAPVTFSQSLHLPSLSYAGTALKSCSAYYTTTSLFTHEAASRENFFKNASSYAIVNIFSHARADTTGREPVLFMQDSDIHLSELQLLQKPATQLVLLSACETNVGKAATGEGVYSLARGFAAAGIPAVAATLWKADEKTIYAISEKFNQYLSEGMNKDEALQKAKLDFIQNNQGTEKLLPYYWANMILIGNTDAVNLSSSHHYAVWVTAAILLMAIAWIVLYRRKKKKL
jgi:CHAT domain-containing protein